MLSSKEALERIVCRLSKTKPTHVPLDETLGTVLCNPFYAQNSSPPFNSSAMDGFALRSKETKEASKKHPKTFSITDTVYAGDYLESKIGIGSGVRIMTGGCVPAGLDCVVPFEQTTYEGTHMELQQPAVSGQYIRPEGDDYKKADLLLDEGTVVTPPLLGLLASAGANVLNVRKKPSVAVVISGDELQKTGSTLYKSKIYDANGPILKGYIERYGGQVSLFKRVGDDLEEIKEVLSTAAKKSDIVVYTGGVSVGDRDFAKKALQEVFFWQVGIKPGRQFLFGQANNVPVFGLPGNPVSTIVCFLKLVGPAIRFLRGERFYEKTNSFFATATEGIKSIKSLETYSRVIVEQSGFEKTLKIAGNQSSGALSSFVFSNALAVCPIGVDRIEVGDKVLVEAF